MNTDYIETADGKYALCTVGRFKNWIMYKHPDGQWVSLRPAFAHEIAAGLSKDDFENRHDRPCRA